MLATLQQGNCIYLFNRVLLMAIVYAVTFHKVCCIKTKVFIRLSAN